MKQFGLTTLFKSHLDRIADTIGLISVTVIIAFSFLLPSNILGYN